MDITDIYRTVPPNTKEYIFSKTDHILGYKASFNKQKHWNEHSDSTRQPWIKAQYWQKKHHKFTETEKFY